MLTRNFGKLLHGKVTPFQTLAACTLGVMLGMQPSFSHAPLTVAALVAVLFVLNANLFLAGLAILLGKLLLVGLLPVSFGLGRVVIDGPLQPLFRGMVNAPVLALAGLEYYVTVGGLVLGLVIGLAVGWLLVVILKRLRKGLAGLEAGSPRYAAWSQKRSLRAITWLLLGGKGKKTYAELAASSKLGNPIRPLGAAAVVLLLVLVGLVYVFLADTLVTAVAVRSLERFNGATVDLDRAQVSLADGRLTLEGLAMADASALGTNLFQAGELTANISAADLLRKRLALDEVRVSNASTGTARRSRGVLIGPPPRPVEVEPPAADEKTLEDYLADAELWQQRLARLRQWLDTVSGPPSDEAEPDAPTFEDWVQARVAQLGYANVAADHLIEGAPTFLMREFLAEGVVAEQLDRQMIDILATNLSTHPALVDAPPRLRVTSSTGDRLRLDVDLPVRAAGRETGQVDFALRGLPVDETAQKLAPDQKLPLAGGTWDLTVQGGFSPASLTLPVMLVLRGTTFNLPGGQPRLVEALPLTVEARGAVDSPRFYLDPQQIRQALIAAGAGELVNQAKGEVNKAVEDGKAKLGETVGGALKDLWGKKEKNEPQP